MLLPLVIHVFVALCDNKHQGIVPVPAAIGNGQDPRNNLYWGADYGLKSWMLRHEKWERVNATGTKPAQVLERLVLKRTIDGRVVYIVADAWDGAEIRSTIDDFLESAAGHRRGVVTTSDGTRLGTGAAADVIAYVGHDGLMDFTSSARLTPVGTAHPRSIVLACASRPYFEPLLVRAGSKPLLLTAGLMAPEAYTLGAAIEACVSGTCARLRPRRTTSTSRAGSRARGGCSTFRDLERSVHRPFAGGATWPTHSLPEPWRLISG